MKCSLTLAAIMAATLTGPANAWSPVHCVQSILTEVATENVNIPDPKGIDGGIGDGARASYAAFRAENPNLNLPENFTAQNARETCRLLEERPTLYGNNGKVVRNVNTGEVTLIRNHPTTLTYGPHSKLAISLFGFGLGSTGQNTYDVTEMTSQERAFLQTVATQFAGEAKLGRGWADVHFMTKLAEEPVQALTLTANTDGVDRFELLHFGSDGLVRAIVLSNFNGNRAALDLTQVEGIYVAGTAEALATHAEVVGEIDFAYLNIDDPNAETVITTVGN